MVEEKRRGPFPLLPVAALTIAVAVRAIGGCAAVFPWNTGIATAVATAVFVFAGKTAGGFLCDRTDALRTSAVSILPAAVLTAFAAFCALLAAASINGVSYAPVISGCIMLFVPGIPITNSIRDFLSGNMLSGVARLTEACIISVSLAAGAGVIIKLWYMLGGITL